MGQRSQAGCCGGEAARPGQGSSEQERRALDAATDLILRPGSHKTTIDDIAREARVNRSVFYLHIQTREALLTTLVIRERIALTEDLKQRIAGDPAGAALRERPTHSALALMQRPLLQALRDTEACGLEVERKQHNAGTMEAPAGITHDLQGLHERGQVRTDLPLHARISLSVPFDFSRLLPGRPPAARRLQAFRRATGRDDRRDRSSRAGARRTRFTRSSARRRRRPEILAGSGYGERTTIQRSRGGGPLAAPPPRGSTEDS